MKRLSLRLFAAAVVSVAGLSACGSDDATVVVAPSPPPAATTATFEIRLVNLTAGQSLSPLVAIAHNDGYRLFAIGEAATVGLERVAEGGATAGLIAEASDSRSVFGTAVASGGLPPGAGNSATVTLVVPLDGLASFRLSLASMLGNTNDGLALLNAQSIGTLAVGQSVQADLLSYDAGTELNSESADTVPGSATAGSGGRREGFSPVRDDVVGTVHLHPGVVSRDDDLATSALTHVQRWDNPVALVSIRRTQ
ncbi:MAG: spondin domain-containing protein [Betaproteobacteria bacterium]